MAAEALCIDYDVVLRMVIKNLVDDALSRFKMTGLDTKPTEYGIHFSVIE